jgi:hypothetical protein
VYATSDDDNNYNTHQNSPHSNKVVSNDRLHSPTNSNKVKFYSPQIIATQKDDTVISESSTLTPSNTCKDTEVTFVDNLLATPGTKKRRFSLVQKADDDIVPISISLIQSSSVAARLAAAPPAPHRRAPSRPS